jgi:hypothetical protein
MTAQYGLCAASGGQTGEKNQLISVKGLCKKVHTTAGWEEEGLCNIYCFLLSWEDTEVIFFLRSFYYNVCASESKMSAITLDFCQL